MGQDGKTRSDGQKMIAFRIQQQMSQNKYAPAAVVDGMGLAPFPRVIEGFSARQRRMAVSSILDVVQTESQHNVQLKSWLQIQSKPLGIQALGRAISQAVPEQGRWTLDT
ncbi:hypothetical protein GX48_05779 [Paracoccidioides brasiliensis]|nr:hypothetical protein GX48_05779 [Paracoccidioides brasiliensis]